jgi:hypothetical protein
MSGFRGCSNRAFLIQSQLLPAVAGPAGGTVAKEPEQVPRSPADARFKGKSLNVPALDAVATDVSVGAKLHINF